VEKNLLNKIISVAYGDASIFDRIKIYGLSKNNAEIKSILDDHKKIADAAHQLNLEKCPQKIIDSVQVKNGQKHVNTSSLLTDLYTFIFGKPILSTAVFSIIILALVSTLIFRRPEIHQQYSKQEIEVADQQVKQSLALIAGVFNKTKTTVEYDVLTDRVSRPIKESFNIVNEFLQGDNNEKIN
jgi:hypothetical protein